MYSVGYSSAYLSFVNKEIKVRLSFTNATARDMKIEPQVLHTAGSMGDKAEAAQAAARFRPDHTERFTPCVAFTSPQSSMQSGTSSSGSGSFLRAPRGEATTMGSGPHSSRNSTT